MSKKSHKALASATVMSLILTSTLTATVSAATGVERLSGSNRETTAIDVATKVFEKAETVVLVNGYKSADALSATPLAKAYNAPILSVGAVDEPTAALTKALADLGAKKVIVVGGEGAVTKALAAKLAETYTVERIEGKDRYATNVAVAEKVMELKKSKEAFVVNGSDASYADALSIASIAASKGAPIVFTNGKTVSEEAKALVKGLEVTAIGGTGVVSADVLAAVDATRVGGADRFATNLEVLKAYKDVIKLDNVFVAYGLNFADALVASAAAAKTDAPVVLADKTNTKFTEGATDFIEANKAAIKNVYLVGGTGVIGDSVKNAIDGIVNPVVTSLAVESVSAINLNQIEVKFTQPVDETSAETAANYSLGGVDLTASDKFDLSSDKKTLTINLNTAKAQYAKAILKVKGNVVTGENASTTTVPTFSQELTFSDITVPTVKTITVTGNKKITVVFSETVNMQNVAANAGTMFKINGQYLTNYGFSGATVLNLTANNYANKVELNFATAIPAGTHTFTTLAGTATDLIDAANFKVAEQTNNITIASVTDAPTVTSVTGESNGTIYVTYNRSMGSNALVAANYQMNGTVLPSAGTFKSGTGSTVVKFTGITNVAKGANVLTILKDTVTDSYGNKLDVNNDTRISFAATEDTVKPTVTSVTAITNTKVRVKFSEAVNNAYATNLANYKLKDSTGATVGLLVTPVAVGTTPTDTYDITTPALTGSNYTLQIKNIVDTAATPNTMDTYTATFNGYDDVAPTVTEAVQVGVTPSQKVAVMFSEAMDSATISNTANYYYIDSASVTRALPSGTTVVPGSDNKSVQITFPSSYLVNGAGATAEYNVANLVIGNVKDVAGNILSNISYTTTSIVGAGSGTVQPSYVNNTLTLTATSSKVTAEFELNQNITALNKADFLVGDGTNIVADATNLVADSAYISGKKIVLEYTTPASVAALKALGNGVKLTTVVAPTSTNVYGTKVAPIIVANAKPVYDDMIAPTIVSVSATDNASPSGDTVTITFSEAIDGTIAGLYTNDFTIESAGTIKTVSSASVVGNVLTLTLADGALTAGDTVTVKAISANISIKDLDNDGAGTSNAYVPTSTDISGRTVTIN